jgi:hypothetical protein
MPAEVLVAPYLPLSQRTSVGPWELIPRAQLAAADVSEAWVLEQVQHLLNAYREQDRSSVAFGVVLRAHDARVGDAIDRSKPPSLRRAFLAAVLESNPSALTPESERTGNEGHARVTSDNVLVYGHPLREDGMVADEWGAMAPRLVGGLRLGRPGVRFEGPGEIGIPARSTHFDAEYASAVYAEFGKESDTSRRIARALDWLGIAWRNTTALEPENRVIALRIGFEALLGAGESTRALREALSALIDPPDAPRTWRSWTERGTVQGPFELTDAEWWFQSFSLLRNHVMHGDETPRAAWSHDGTNHVWIAEDTLRKAIKETLIREGHSADLRRDHLERQIRRRITRPGESQAL